MTKRERDDFKRVRQATGAAMEALELRRLLAGDLSLVNALPFVLRFDKARKGMVDQDGQGTGFSYVQPNSQGDEYIASKIDLNPSAGLLTITTTGDASAGSNYSSDNTQTNALGTQFNGASGSFSVSTTLKGPLGYLNESFEQAGIYFGPDQDNYVKLVAGVGTAGAGLQFLAETKSGSSFSFPLGGNGSNLSIGAFSSVQSLVLTLSGNASTGKVQAFYSVNDGATQQFGTSLTLSSTQKSQFFAAISRAGVMASHKNNDGGITAAFDRFAIDASVPAESGPSIIAVRPGDGATAVARDAFVAADVFLPLAGAGVDSATLSTDSVRLERVSDGAIVAATLNTSGGGDSVVLQPTDALDANTQYRFVVTVNLKTVDGASFAPFQSTFTTGTSISSADPRIAFEKVRLPSAEGRLFSGVTIGPDQRLYATTLTGEICRWDIDPGTGALGQAQVIDTIVQANGGNRFATGIVFDPRSTADNLIAWVTHSDYAFEGAADWSGRISMLYGSNLESYKEMVVGLPRSIRDHTTNQPSFGPDGFLYVPQGAMTAMGRADPTWGNRDEHELSGAILRIDAAGLVARRKAGNGPLHVKTASGGTYNPDAAGALVKIYGEGVRNAYDMVFHSNGHLYAPANGSAAGGNTPAGGGAPALTAVSSTQSDFLFDVVAGGYYGHPNPTRGHFVLNGGNPTSGKDKFEVTQYPAGTAPDADYRGAVYDFGKSYSPDGVIEYRGKSFKGLLDRKILVARYSGGDDIVAITLDAKGNVAKVESGITGLTHFVDPLDLTEDMRNGSLYVVEYGAERITLLRTITGGPNLSASDSRVLLNDIRGDNKSTTQTIKISNTGSAPLEIPAGGIRLKGASASLFRLPGAPTDGVTIAVGQSIDLTIGFNANSDTSVEPRGATLNISSNDPDQPGSNIRLRGLPTTGEGGANEPSLQRILDLYQIPINVGDPNPNDTFLNPPSAPNDEITIQRLMKAGSGSVSIDVLAVFAVNTNPAIRFGFYEPGTPANTTELFTINGDDAQSVNVSPQGSTMFDPGDMPFGLYGLFPKFVNSDGSVRVVYEEDSLNSWESITGNRRKVRFYPLKNDAGETVPNAYIFAFEEFTRDYDQQDIVGVIRNVRPATSAPEIGLENLDGAPFFDRLVFNRIENLDPDFPNVFKDTGRVRIRNTGDQALSISSIGISGNFSVISGGGAATIQPGSFRDVTIRFTATGGDIHNGFLTINSNDPDEPQRRVKLSGFWQSYSENDPDFRSQEPSLAEVLQVFGYTTVVVGSGQSINTGGNIVRVGDEILSSFWQRADGSQPVRVRQLAAFHNQGDTATISWFVKGAAGSTALVTHTAADGQSFLPRKKDQTANPTVASFAPPVSQQFGFRVDNIWSEEARNNTSNGGEGHYMRFYPVRDQNGSFVENTWILAMDYELILPDYQDNIYLIENMYPAGQPTPPDGLNGVRTGGRIVLDWADNPETDTVGYNVFRSLSPTGQFTKRNGVLLSSSSFSESTDFAQGTKVYYRVSAVTADGDESVPSSVIVVV